MDMNKVLKLENICPSSDVYTRIIKNILKNERVCRDIYQNHSSDIYIYIYLFIPQCVGDHHGNL